MASCTVPTRTKAYTPQATSTNSRQMDIDIKNDTPTITAVNRGTAARMQSAAPMRLARSYSGAKAARRSRTSAVTPCSVSMGSFSRNSYSRTAAPHCINSTTATATSTSSAIIPKPPARLSSKPSSPSSLTVPSASSGMGLTMQSAVASAICGALACALVR